MIINLNNLTEINLPQIRGEYRFDYAIGKNIWFRAGGNAKVLFRPKDKEDLSNFLKNKPSDLKYICIGVGSNLIIRDGGFDGVVIRLGGEFNFTEVNNDIIRCGAATLDANVGRFAANEALGGLEFLVGIPGTIGGAIAMNGGAYEREIKDILVSATGVAEDGEIITLTNSELNFSYRKSNPKKNEIEKKLIWVEAELKGDKGNKDEILNKMNFISESREKSQPVRAKTGGSTFKNPDNSDKKAWQLIDEAGCRGLKIGDAQVSEKHCNFLINTGAATAADIENLGEEVRRRVKEKSGIELHWEIKIIGER